MINLLVKLFGDIHLQTLSFEDGQFTCSMLYYELHFGSNLSVIRESLKLPKKKLKMIIIAPLYAFSWLKNIKLQFNYKLSVFGNKLMSVIEIS